MTRRYCEVNALGIVKFDKKEISDQQAPNRYGGTEFVFSEGNSHAMTEYFAASLKTSSSVYGPFLSPFG